jgi:hypothetical protein
MTMCIYTFILVNKTIKCNAQKNDRSSIQFSINNDYHNANSLGLVDHYSQEMAAVAALKLRPAGNQNMRIVIINIGRNLH